MKRRRFFPALAAFVAAPMAALKIIGSGQPARGFHVVDAILEANGAGIDTATYPEWNTLSARYRVDDMDTKLRRMFAEACKRDQERALEALSERFFSEV